MTQPFFFQNKKIFNTYFIKWRHEKKCKEQKPNTKLEIIEKQNLKLEKQNEDMKLQLEELKELIQIGRAHV